MKRFETMSEAAAEAAGLCNIWLIRADDATVEKEGLLMLAEAFDRERVNMEKNPAAFLCSKEGALGLTFDYEFNAQWLFYPLPDESHVEEEILADLERKLDRLEGLSTEELKNIWNR